MALDVEPELGAEFLKQDAEEWSLVKVMGLAKECREILVNFAEIVKRSNHAVRGNPAVGVRIPDDVLLN